MWPSQAEPALGAFLVPLVDQLRAAGHEVTVSAAGGGGRARHAALAADAVRAARRERPDVVFAHFLFPAGAAGLAAARAAQAPLVVMAHGQDVANLERAALRVATRPVVRGAAAVIANSRWLAERLTGHFPGLAVEVCDLGVDTRLFAPRDDASVQWAGEHPRFLCIGALIERKNVVGLADAFAALGRGSLAFVGDGPLRSALDGRDGVHVAGAVPHDGVRDWIAACDVVCQPSLVEPLGQALLEAMAMGRSVVATREGGPAEFVTPDAGVLVDPRDPEALRAGLERAAAMPRPNLAARAVAEQHDLRDQAARMLAVLERAVAQSRD